MLLSNWHNLDLESTDSALDNKPQDKIVGYKVNDSKTISFS